MDISKKNIKKLKQKKTYRLVDKKDTKLVKTTTDKTINKNSIKRTAKALEEIRNLQNKIASNQKTIWCPSSTAVLTQKNKNPCCDIHSYTKPSVDTNTTINLKINSKDVYRCHQVKIYPTGEQRKVLNKYFNACIDLYNETLFYIKKNYKEGNKTILNWKTIKTTVMKEKIKELISKSNTLNIKEDCGIKKCKLSNNGINSHILVNAIKHACSNYQAALTNLKNKNISHFRIRYWRKDKPVKMMEIEKLCFSQKTGLLCPSIFSKLEIENVKINKKKFELIDIINIYNCDCKLQYNSQTDEYILYIPQLMKTSTKYNNYSKDNVCSLDPGIRTFMTGLSENTVVKIGEQIKHKITEKLDRLDLIKKRDIPVKKKRKNEKIINRQIKHMVDELHWKTAGYLVSNYKNILIGDLSIKSIVSTKLNLPKIVKRIGLKLRFFQFKQRLQYKCNLHAIGYCEVNERYTSKICSCCGAIKEDLGTNSIYNCNACKSVINRDVNGSRNIYFKAC